MIHPDCFSQPWLREQAETTRARDPKNLEKCILALELVSRMQRAGLDFIFKGWTSLVLLFDPVRRLSIDVDILSPQEINDKTAFFRHGIRALDSHLFTLPFQRAESRLAAGHAALVAELIRNNRVDYGLPAFISAASDLQALRDASLDGTWINLNRLKRTDIKAFECWHQAQLMRAHKP